MEFVVSNKVLKEIKIDCQNDDVKDLIIPNGVEVLGGGKLKVKKDSSAHKYAVENNLNYEEI